MAEDVAVGIGAGIGAGAGTDAATDTVRLSAVGQVLRGRWRLLVALACAGALLGVGASVVFSPGYETTADVLLQGPRDPDQLRTEAQVAMSTVVLDRSAAGLRWASAADLADQVSAAVAEGNIITITVQADTPERAKELADRVAQEYVTYSVQLLSDTADSSVRLSQEQQQTLRQHVLETNQRIAELHDSAGGGDTIDSVGVRTELASLRTALTQAMTKLDELGAATSQAKMVVLGPAERPTSPSAPTMVHFAAGGAAAFLLAGLFGHLFGARTERRLTDEARIVAALGTDPLGEVEHPADPTAAAPTGIRPRLRRFFLGDRPWHETEPPAPSAEAMDIRYRRVLSRLREHTPPGGPPRVLVVVVTADDTAGQAARRLVDTAGGRLLAPVEVTPDRPVVPGADRVGAVAGALVVVTSGTRTPWELVGIAEACADAGLPVLGAVLVRRTRPADPTPPPVPATARAGAP